MQNNMIEALEKSIRLLSAEILQHLNTEHADIEAITDIMARRDDFIYSAYQGASDELRQQLFELLGPLMLVERAALLPYRDELLSLRKSLSSANQLLNYIN